MLTDTEKQIARVLESEPKEIQIEILQRSIRAENDPQLQIIYERYLEKLQRLGGWLFKKIMRNQISFFDFFISDRSMKLKKIISKYALLFVSLPPQGKYHSENGENVFQEQNATASRECVDTL